MNHLSKERVGNTDHVCSMKSITKHDHFRLVFIRLCISGNLLAYVTFSETNLPRIEVKIVLFFHFLLVRIDWQQSNHGTSTKESQDSIQHCMSTEDVGRVFACQNTLVNTCNFCCDFLLLMDMNEWISYECI